VSKLSEEALAGVLVRLPSAVVVVDVHDRIRFANVAVRRLWHPTIIRRGATLAETSAPVFTDLVNTAFDVGLVHRKEVAVGEHTYAVTASLDRPSMLVTLLIEDVSVRSRKNRSAEDFLVNASHEILSPIAAIAGAIQVLQDGAKDDPVARERFLGHIAAASERLTSAATALLVLAKAEAGHGGPRLELVPLSPVLEDITEAKGGVNVFCSSDVAVLADASVLRQAVATLVDNARRHSASVSVDVGEADGMVSIDVVDGGSGILPENLERVTDRFFSAGGRDSGRYGVGLSIADRAAKVLGGTLELASDRKGTLARLKLPSARLL